MLSDILTQLCTKSHQANQPSKSGAGNSQVSDKKKEENTNNGKPVNDADANSPGYHRPQVGDSVFTGGEPEGEVEPSDSDFVGEEDDTESTDERRRKRIDESYYDAGNTESENEAQRLQDVHHEAR